MIRVCLRSESAVTRAYFSALLFDVAEVACVAERDPIPPSSILLTDLDTVAPPRRIPSGCRHITVASAGTPDILRPMTDREVLNVLFLREAEAGEPHLLDLPPRLSACGAEIHLSETEHRLLSALIGGAAVRYADLISLVWKDKGADENILRVTVSNLRKKLAPYGIVLKAEAGAYVCRFPRGV